MDAAEGELLQTEQWCSLYRNAQADQRIVDGIAAVPLGGVLAGARDGEMSQVGQLRYGVDECWNIRRGMEDGRILLGQNFTQLGRSIFWALDHGGG